MLGYSAERVDIGVTIRNVKLGMDLIENRCDGGQFYRDGTYPTNRVVAIFELGCHSLGCWIFVVFTECSSQCVRQFQNRCGVAEYGINPSRSQLSDNPRTGFRNAKDFPSLE